VALVKSRFSRALAGMIGIACSVVLAAAGASATGSNAAPVNEQHAEAHTDQEARSNTGHNRSFDVVLGHNAVAQTASSSGGDATNGNSATNTNAGSAGVATGNAGAGNSSGVSGSQTNNAPAPVEETDAEREQVAAVVVETVAAAAPSEQHIDVQTTQLATATTGDNLSASVVVGTNDTTQTATTPDAGAAANTNVATNNGTSSSAITTGDATGSNSSNTAFTQANG
jgi:hypothetical protein